METHILWADDEIELLRPHVIFLENKGYRITTVNSGVDAIEEVRKQTFDVVFLDENMPGLTGIQTLEQVKLLQPDVPVIMITKSEEEHIMEDAIGAKIADYLIKPVNPNQILLSLKKNLEKKKLVGERTLTGYQQEFRQIGMRLLERPDWNAWKELYNTLLYWEIELDQADDPSMNEILSMQRTEANSLWAKYIENNYIEWLSGKAHQVPLMSHQVVKEKLVPLVKNEQVLFVVIDNLRQDQWRIIKSVLAPYYNVREEDQYMSILPTATQYARNALFAGMMPSEIQKRFPNLWIDESEEGSKNQSEEVFLESNLKRLGVNVKFSYHKISNLASGKKLADQFSNLKQNQLNVVVYNFVDMLSHARTDMEVIKELADNEKAYRSLTKSWFEHSPLLEILKKAASSGMTTVITTDHGTVHVKDPSRIVGDRNTNTNLRYKVGRNLTFEKKDVFEVRNPDQIHLPKGSMSTVYVFAKEQHYFVYPNNYNQYVNMYRNTFQHGGISMEEMIIPFIVLEPKK